MYLATQPSASHAARISLFLQAELQPENHTLFLAILGLGGVRENRDSLCSVSEASNVEFPVSGRYGRICYGRFRGGAAVCVGAACSGHDRPHWLEAAQLLSAGGFTPLRSANRHREETSEGALQIHYSN